MIWAYSFIVSFPYKKNNLFSRYFLISFDTFSDDEYRGIWVLNLLEMKVEKKAFLGTFKNEWKYFSLVELKYWWSGWR